MSQKKTPSLAMSVFCSLMIGSPLLSTGSQAFQAAGVASGDVMQAKEIEALQSFAKEGWTVSPDSAKTSLPGAVRPGKVTPARVQAAEEGELEPLARYVLENGKNETLGGAFSKWLGYPTDENTPMPCKQIRINGEKYAQLIYAITVGGKTDLVVNLRSLDLRDGWFYRVNLDGALIESVHGGKFDNPHLRAIPPTEGLPMLFREIAFWKSQVPAPQVASQQ